MFGVRPAEPVGMPGRAIGSKFLDEVESGQRKPKNCPVNCIKTCDVEKAPYCIIASLISALRGNFKNGYAFAGSNVWKTDKIISVNELFKNTALIPTSRSCSTWSFINEISGEITTVKPSKINEGI